MSKKNNRVFRRNGHILLCRFFSWGHNFFNYGFRSKSELTEQKNDLSKKNCFKLENNCEQPH